MSDRTKQKRRLAMELTPSTLVINVTEEELSLVRQGKLAIERIKSTPKYDVYRVKHGSK